MAKAIPPPSMGTEQEFGNNETPVPVKKLTANGLISPLPFAGPDVARRSSLSAVRRDSSPTKDLDSTGTLTPTGSSTPIRGRRASISGSPRDRRSRSTKAVKRRTMILSKKFVTELPDAEDQRETHNEIIQQIRDLSQEMMNDLELKDRRYRLKIYRNCFAGSDAVTWLVNRGYALSRQEAVTIAKRMIQAGMIVHCAGERNFKDDGNCYTPALSTPRQVDLTKGKGTIVKEAAIAAEETGEVSDTGAETVTPEYTLAELARNMKNFIEIKDRRNKTRTKMYEGCFLGKDAVKWMLRHHYASNEMAAVRLGNALMLGGFIQHVSDKRNFENSGVFYRFVEDDDDTESIKSSSLVNHPSATTTSESPTRLHRSSGGSGDQFTPTMTEDEKSGLDLSTGYDFSGDLIDPVNEDIAEEEVREIAHRMAGSLKTSDKRQGKVTYVNAFTGKSAVSWMIKEGYAANDTQALHLGNDMIMFGLMFHVSKESPFTNDSQLFLFALQDALELDVEERRHRLEGMSVTAYNEQEEFLNKFLEELDTRTGDSQVSDGVLYLALRARDMTPVIAPNIKKGKLQIRDIHPGLAPARLSNLAISYKKLLSFEGLNLQEDSLHMDPPKTVFIDPNDAVSMLQDGIMVQRHESRSFVRHFLQLDDLEMILMWRHKTAGYIETSICIPDIVDVRRCVFHKKARNMNNAASLAQRTLCVVFGDWHYIDIVCDSLQDHDFIYQAIQELRKRHTDAINGRAPYVQYWLRQEYLQSGMLEADGNISSAKALMLIERLLGVKKSELDADILTISLNKGFLTFHNFLDLYRLLMGGERLIAIFNSFCSDSKVMTAQDFGHFLNSVQREHVTSKELEEIMEKYGDTKRKTISVRKFFAYMYSKDNWYVDRSTLLPPKVPLLGAFSTYYIDSSHNTYLMGDQLRGDSSVEGYIRALLRGCRSIELDCWDGNDGQPIITHGRTLTTRISFISVIKVIYHYAFIASPYPLILSIENHCSVSQQRVMVEQFRNVFGEHLLDAIVDDFTEEHPPLELLKYRVLVKTKVLNSSRSPSNSKRIRANSQLTSSSPPHSQDLGDSEVPKNPKALHQQLSQQDPPSNGSEPDREAEQSTAEKSSPSASTRSNEEMRLPLTPKRGGRRRGKSLSWMTDDGPLNTDLVSYHREPQAPITEALGALSVYLKGVRVGTLGYCAEEQSSFEMISHGEIKARRFTESLKLATVWAEHLKKHVCRVYPSVKRYNSTNFDPVRYWNCGVQMVALNYQTPGRALQLNHFMFRQNGGIGYVAKPFDLIRSDATFDGSLRDTKNIEEEMELLVRVESAHRLTGYFSHGHVMLELRLCGHQRDYQIITTSVKKKNSLDPIWNETARFMVRYPSSAFLMVSAVQVKPQGKVLSSAVIPIHAIKQGYRPLWLETANCRPVDSACVFLHFTKKYSITRTSNLTLALDAQTSRASIASDLSSTASSTTPSLRHTSQW
eukprot:Clim_evm32s147 gene=Clim_evmTU32s147